MYDRVLKSELMESNRWLELHSDTGRLAYVCLIPLADDFGNLEAGSKRLWRYLKDRTALKAEADVVKVLSELIDADLVGHYIVEDIEYLHIRRWECARDYIVRRCPKSPWDDIEQPQLEQRMVDIKARRRAKARADSTNTPIDSQGDSANVRSTFSEPVRSTSSEPSPNVQRKFSTGVGVGVGEGIKKDVLRTSKESQRSPNVRGTRLPPTWVIPADWVDWAIAYSAEPDHGNLQLGYRDVLPHSEQFRDYWTARAGKDATKRDWQATWRNAWRDLYHPKLAKSQAGSASQASTASGYDPNRGI